MIYFSLSDIDTDMDSHSNWSERYEVKDYAELLPVSSSRLCTNAGLHITAENSVPTTFNATIQSDTPSHRGTLVQENAAHKCQLVL